MQGRIQGYALEPAHNAQMLIFLACAHRYWKVLLDVAFSKITGACTQDRNVSE